MIDSAKVLYSKGGNDECLTPEYGVTPLLEFLSAKFSLYDITIWCPFDKDDSEFVKVFRQNGYNVIASHIDNGEDFYTYEPEKDWDIMISNPPFTNKRHIFERALSFNKPFALLMSNTWLNDSAPKQLFKDIDLQLLMFDKRIEYIQNGKANNKITFSSSYYCRDFLFKQIIMRELCKK